MLYSYEKIKEEIKHDKELDREVIEIKNKIKN